MSSMPVKGSAVPAPTVGVKPPAVVGMHSGPVHASATGMQSVTHGASVPVVGTVVVVVDGTVVVVGVEVVGVDVVGVVVCGTSVVGVDVVGVSVVVVLVSLDGAVVVSLLSFADAVGTKTTRPAIATAIAMVRFTVVLPEGGAVSLRR